MSIPERSKTDVLNPSINRNIAPNSSGIALGSTLVDEPIDDWDLIARKPGLENLSLTP